MWHMQSKRWTCHTTSGCHPTHVRFSSSWLHGDHVYMFAGSDGKSYSNDIHKLNTQTYTWHKCAPTGTRPSPRCGCVCWYTGDRAVVFGGIGNRPTNVKDNEQIVQSKNTSGYFNNQVFYNQPMGSRCFDRRTGRGLCRSVGSSCSRIAHSGREWCT